MLGWLLGPCRRHVLSLNLITQVMAWCLVWPSHNPNLAYYDLHVPSLLHIQCDISSWISKCLLSIPDSTVHGANMGPTWVLSVPDVPHVDPMNFAIRDILWSLQWRHNGCDGVSKHRRLDCVLNRLFRRRSKNTSKLCVTGLWGWNSKITSELSAQWASYAENVSIWWRHQGECSWYSAIIHEQLSHFSFDWEGNSPFVWGSMINDLWNYVNNGCTLGNNNTLAKPISKPIWQLNKTWMIRLMLIKTLFCTNGIDRCKNQCYPLLIHIIT